MPADRSLERTAQRHSVNGVAVNAKPDDTPHEYQFTSWLPDRSKQITAFPEEIARHL
jgi:hypothetical protein